ncbi:MAG: hypothetical protein L3J89_14250 [Gammaproteobacteria bacterium]|nr:hypothetical protein [Gammaproteobacteria bacterium]
MITNNQLMLATACLFSVALLSGCVSKSTVSDNDIDVPPTVEVVKAPEAVKPAEPEVAEIIEVEDAIKAIESIRTVGITDASEADAPKVTTTKDGVVVIPLGVSLEEVAAATAKPPEPVALPNIPNIAEAIANHQNSMWHSRSFTYSIYLGGHLNAEYSQEKNALTIINQADEANQFACNYSTKNGGLASVKDDEVSACHSLANELQSYLDEE